MRPILIPLADDLDAVVLARLCATEGRLIGVDAALAVEDAGVWNKATSVA